MLVGLSQAMQNPKVAIEAQETLMGCLCLVINLDNPCPTRHVV